MRPADLVVVVGWNRGVRDVLARALERDLPVRAVSMSGGDAAVAWVRVLRPALVLAEVRATATDGCATVRRLRGHRETADLPILAIGVPEVGAAARAAGCDTFLGTASTADVVRAVGNWLRAAAV
jgi:CheY-like chemotaxis protein